MPEDVLSWRPRVRPSVSVRRVDGDLLTKSTGDRRVKRFAVLEIVHRALPLLDGTRTVADLVDELCGESEQDVVDLCTALVALRQERILTAAVRDQSTCAPEQLAFYDRQIRLLQDICDQGMSDVDSGIALQNRLTASTVAIVGIGGLGSHVASLLAMAGVGTLRICDVDRVEASNLSRQILFADKDIGVLKVEAAAARMTAMNPYVRVEPVNRHITGPADLADVVAGADVVVCCADQPSVEEMADLVSDACWPAIPHIVGGAYAFHTAVLGQTVVPGRTACRDCRRAAIPNEDNELPPAIVRKRDSAGAIGALASMIASALAWDAIRLVTRLPPVLANRVVEIDYHTLAQHIREIPPDPRCQRCASARQQAPN